MQPTLKRAKSIYSVIASPNRLEILRILNTKGPLTYSELKTLSGFKSKKESGKFAYHLRKLVKQMLITLNRSERRYTITNLGRLILNFTRQIEEQFAIESGKLYVRTSRHTIEEFNPDKILQSLVREAGMPVELAEKIASEAEARLHKFQTMYLTAPLIREFVNALLIEHGYEEYRHKLTRLGMPVYDVTELINKVSNSNSAIESLITQTAHSVFSEYLLLTQLSRDVADAHLSGDIHISNIGFWALMPDTLFMDLTPIQLNGISLRNKLLSIPRMPPPKNFEEAISIWILLSKLLADEVSSEITFENFVSYLAKYASEIKEDDLKKEFKKCFLLINGHDKPIISIRLMDKPTNGLKIDESLYYKVLRGIFEAYKDYVEIVPLPKLKLITILTNSSTIPSLSELIAPIINAGGSIALSTQPEYIHTYSGLRGDIALSHEVSDTIMLHSLSINLPRLAYESNRDEAYFRAKLALLIQLVLNAFTTRKRLLNNIMERELLPTLKYSTTTYRMSMPFIINMVGLNEAIFNLSGGKISSIDKRGLEEKILDIAVNMVNDKAEKIGEKAGVSILIDESGMRFVSLDSERYGKAVSGLGIKEYSQSPRFTIAELFDQEVIKELDLCFKKLDGGFSVSIEVFEELSPENIKELINKSMNHIAHFKIYRVASICTNCGKRNLGIVNKCKDCNSASLSKLLL
ncbi:MAG: anaerobic ribonucleoside-triphosphate reductase [Nitrososphaerales archaeon]